MTEFKKGDTVKHIGSGKMYQVRGSASYYVDGDGSLDIVDAVYLEAVPAEEAYRLAHERLQRARAEVISAEGAIKLLNSDQN